VESPVAEQVVRGPQEGFTENIVTNTGLLRRRLRTPDLLFERVVVGRRSRTNVLVAYMLGLTNPALLDEARRRLSGIDIDMLEGSGTLEQLLEDSPRGFFPTIQDTQRPDRAAAALAEGRLVFFVDGSPFALIAPVGFANFLHSPEDYYIKWPFGSILRFIRICGLLATLLLPATYIAIANFHQEMIPSSLLLAIAASRENVPFPAQFEVMMMEIAFEVIREGSLRIPTVLGQTVGIVGALILGQAAVMANIVSPILVIVVATTALGSFTIPNYGLSLPVRFGRFLFIGLAGTFGLYGIAAGLFLVSAQAASLRSFGVPYLAPSGPHQPGSPDVVVRGPAFAMDQRPSLARPMELQRQAKGLMGWNPEVPQPKQGKGKGSSHEGSNP
jgi:spore germination protein KA